MIEALLERLVALWPAVALTCLIAYSLKSYLNKGLNKYPGPFWAGITDIWRFQDVCKRRPDITQLRLHRHHGDVVRLGPNVLSFASPKALKTIYGLNKGFVKVRHKSTNEENVFANETSPNSTLFNKLSVMASDFLLSSRRPMRRTMQVFVDVSIMRSPCRL